MNVDYHASGPGLVVSDLHLLARRSVGRELMRDLLPDLKAARVLVLNGDTIDFKWSTCATHEETVRRGIEWLQEWIAALPECRIHYVLGNHDCQAEFKPALARLAAAHPRFHWHEFSLRLGDALFLHGDCTNWPMNRAGLEKFRANWSRSRRKGRTAARAYRALDRLGVTRAVHRWHFPQDRTLDRLTHHLDDALPDWRSSVRHCYFGHTHEPFTRVERDGVAFHNTGSAIRDMKFNPLPLAFP